MAQDESGESGDDISVSQETDVSEDNYRRFMELRDASRRQQDQPYAALAPPRGLEKLDQLPESSQKHLRNELRSIIVEGERWTPAESDRPYPFVASPGAESDPELRRQEAEAWDELVANYHAREAEIHAAQGSGRGGTGLRGDVTDGSDERGQRSADSTAASGSAAPRGGAGSGGSASKQAAHRQGSSQNALDYLRQSGQLTASTPSPQAGPPAGSNAGDSAPRGPEGDTQDGGGSAGQPLAQDPAQAQNTAEDRAQTQAGEPPGSPADAAEASAQAPDSAVVYRSEGVIAIRDLEKVTGVDDSEESAGPPSSGKEPADEDQPTRPDDG